MTKVYSKLINNIEKVQTITLQEKIAKSDAIMAIASILGKLNISCKWHKGKWVLKQN